MLPLRGRRAFPLHQDAFPTRNAFNMASKTGTTGLSNANTVDCEER